MHIDDWDDTFLSELSPETYVENLRTAKIQNAMLYFQSHVGLCYYPTKSGKMHSSFIGKEDTMRRIERLCHQNGITVTGYYSLIYNNWAHDMHPEWRMVGKDGKSMLESNTNTSTEFAGNEVFRYGLCCPNNKEYRKFVLRQMSEMAEYFDVDGMFFDMLFWLHPCYCDSCKKRWADEVGDDLPEIEDWNNKKWLLHMQKRREWMAEFAQMVTDEWKRLKPKSSVEHNVAYAVLPEGTSGLAEGVLAASDYAGGDLYGGIYRQSFTCKFYKNITQNQPFEYMFSRCTPRLSMHTLTKSKDEMLSEVFLTAAHHGATLVIDAIDPIGTMDRRVYEQIGEVFDAEIQYERFYSGTMIEDVGVYYSLRSKFNRHNEIYTNHMGAVSITDTMIFNNVVCGVTGGWNDLKKYKVIVASCLTGEDEYDNQRLIDYVKNGGSLYFSGADNEGLIKEFFDGTVVGRTEEKVTYIAPNDAICDCFEHYNPKYPLHFDGSAAVVTGIKDKYTAATVTLPYTKQHTARFASIHSNPPGHPTKIPAVAVRKFGSGVVVWSNLPIECIDMYDYRRIMLNIFKKKLALIPTLVSDAPKDVEITVFIDKNKIKVNVVLLNEDYKARKIESFDIRVRCEKMPESVRILPSETEIGFEYNDGYVRFNVKNMKIFEMYEIRF